jgi:leukotriene-A4 hydrolase
LEQLVGEVNFQKILQNYIKKFRLTSITYTDFKQLFESEVKLLFDQENSEKILSKIDWEKWIKHAGIPSETFDFENKLIDQALSLSQRIQEEKFEDSDFEIFKSWTTNVKLVFLQDLEKNPLTQKVYERLRDSFHLHTGYNSEISSIWYQIAMKNGNSDVIPYVKSFLSSIGRMKYLRPVFRGLNVIRREEALKVFEEYR